MIAPVDDGDLNAGAGETERDGQTAEAGADDDHVVGQDTGSRLKP